MTNCMWTKTDGGRCIQIFTWVKVPIPPGTVMHSITSRNHQIKVINLKKIHRSIIINYESKVKVGYLFCKLSVIISHIIWLWHLMNQCVSVSGTRFNDLIQWSLTTPNQGGSDPSKGSQNKSDGSTRSQLSTFQYSLTLNRIIWSSWEINSY